MFHLEEIIPWECAYSLGYYSTFELAAKAKANYVRNKVDQASKYIWLPTIIMQPHFQ